MSNPVGEPQPTRGFRPIDRSALWDRAYHALREELLGGRLVPGQRLLLRDLAAGLGVSLTPVRDAVNRLIAERVLERGSSGQGGGAIVPMMRAVDFEELALIRGDLEGRAATRAAEIATTADVKRLISVLDQMRRLISNGQLQDYLALHRRFHFELYALACMPVLAELIESLWLRCGPVLSYVIPDYVLQLKGTDLHAAAVDALRRSDGGAASIAIRKDISEAGLYIAGLADENGMIRPPGCPPARKSWANSR